MVSGWRGHWEGNKSYLSDGRIENPKDSCNCLVKWTVAKAKVFGWSFCMEFVYGSHVFVLKRSLPGLFLNKCIPLYSFPSLRICLLIIIKKRKRKRKRTQYSLASIRKFQGILVLGKRQRYFGSEESQLWRSTVARWWHFWGQTPSLHMCSFNGVTRASVSVF